VEFFDGHRLPNVAHNGDGRSSFRLDVGDRGLRQIGVDVVDHHGGACRGEQAGTWRHRFHPRLRSPPLWSPQVRPSLKRPLTACAVPPIYLPSAACLPVRLFRHPDGAVQTVPQETRSPAGCRSRRSIHRHRPQPTSDVAPCAMQVARSVGPGRHRPSRQHRRRARPRPDSPPCPRSPARAPAV
jgi:hypothetical protein